MPIDPTGTNPQPLSKEAAPQTVNIKCRADGCPSITAYEIKQPNGNDSSRMYQCTKCRNITALSVGGFFPY